MLNRSAALKRRPTHLARKLGDVTRWPGLRLKGYTEVDPISWTE